MRSSTTRSPIWTASIAILMLAAAPALAQDSDGDGVLDSEDNCVGCANPDQLDADGDGLGDCWLCDHCDGPGNDTDWDRHCDGVDNCPDDWNASQADIEPNAASIAHGLAQLRTMSNTDLGAMGAKGRELVERQFTWDKIARDMKAVYEWCLGGEKPACIQES